MLVDLHSHTTASDGILTPTALLQRAVDNKIDMLAITDHDSINGIPEALNAIKDQQIAIKFVTGVEISTFWKNNEIHIVGLNIDINHPTLTAFLNQQQQFRITRAQAISEKLAKVSIVNAYEGAKNYAKGDIVSRAHFGRFLVDNGYAKDMNRAFKKYLGKSGYAYVPPLWGTIEQAVNIIKLAGGIAVLAHPSRYDLTATKLKSLMTDFKLSGGEAIEVSQSRQAQDDLYFLARLANEFDFLASQGSDFHGLTHYLDLGQSSPLPQSVKPIWQYL